MSTFETGENNRGEFRIDAALEERRTLSEVNLFIEARNPDGSYSPEFEAGMRDNKITAVQEISISAAVSDVFQPIGEKLDENAEKQQTFLFLGHTALSDLVESGYNYHFSPAGHARIKYAEAPEAKRRERHLTPGITQSMLSVRMTEKDAPHDVAVAEHMADDDAIRTSVAVTDENGKIIGCRTRSLLARDIPHSAWVAMLKDSNNIWNKSFELENEESGLSVMKLFDQLDLSDEMLPEGPVTIVAEVINYIEDEKARASVENQLKKWRGDQAFLKREAEIVADKWMDFDKQLAESLVSGIMHPEVKIFVVQLQDVWRGDMLKLLQKHEKGSDYTMSKKLATQLELAWQKINLGKTSIIVGDERATKSMDKSEVKRLQNDEQFIRVAEAGGINPGEIARLRAMQSVQIAVSNVKPGGGCPGNNNFEFNTETGQLVNSITGETIQVDGTPGEKDPKSLTESSSEGVGKKKMGICRYEECPSRPGETMVGGCRICLKYCQEIFNSGRDPADVYGSTPTKPAEDDSEDQWSVANLFVRKVPEETISKRQLAQEKLLAEEAEEFLALRSGQIALSGVS